MKSYSRLLKYSFIFLFIFSINLSSQDYYEKINKAFEIWGAFFREIALNYVVEIEPEDLAETSIYGMLSLLDPYTVYFDSTESEDIEVVATGMYTGFGISVFVLDGMLTVSETYEGFSAEKNGVRVGDIIYKIDSVVIYKETPDSLRKYTMGRIGSKSSVWFLRNNLQDTIKLELTRQDVRLKNISYFTIYEDSIAYIKIDRFSRSCGYEVRDAYTELKKQHNLKGLILDLRNNPGGLLEAAVSLCEMFFSKNTPIVSTKGRAGGFNHNEYISKINPIDADIPVAVLINGGSASASEIVAGAFQDVDRGIILGERSFGKGLVQTVTELPYNKMLKVTTAKYFTPSGRCIQRVNYDRKHKDGKIKSQPADTIFYTKNGRRVYEAIGIIPDSTISEEKNSSFVDELLDSAIIFKYASFWAANHKSNENLNDNEEIITDFIKYLDSSKIKLKTSSEFDVENILKNLKENSADEKILNEIKEMNITLKEYRNSLIYKNIINLKKVLKEEIEKRFFSQSKIIEKSIISDNSIRIASSLLKSNYYYHILKNDKKRERN